MKRLRIGFVFLAYLAMSSLVTQPVKAQIIPDQTLPNNSLILSPDGQTILINGGTQAGANLFHSFQEFNINTGQFVLFNNGLDVANIFSRITGNNISFINGILSANGTANLFLINPNGITFGQNAQLLLGGSFIGTTASQINFADGGFFKILNPSESLLTVSAPIGLNFDSNPGPIKVRSVGHNLQSDNLFVRDTSESLNPLDTQGSLLVFPTKSLILAGGEIELDGGVLRALGGNIELGAFKNGSVQLDANFSLIPDHSSTYHPIHLRNRSALNNSGLQTGIIKLQGASITLDTGSVIFNQSLNSSWSEPTSQIIIRANNLLIDGISTGIQSGIRSQSLFGHGASIEIESSQIIFRGGAFIQSTSFGAFDAGNITINSNNLKLIGVTPLGERESTVLGSLSFLSGNSGNLDIAANNIVIQDGAGITSGSLSSISGDISIKTQELTVKGFDPITRVFSGITTSTITGQSSNLRVEAQRITIEQGARLDSTAFGSGQGGNIDVIASDYLIISDPASAVSASVEFLPKILQEQFGIVSENLTGNSGNIFINTDQLSLSNQAEIRVDHQGRGDAGNIEISTSNLSLTHHSQITAATESGQGGNIFLRGDRLTLNHSEITTTAGGTGNGGNINLDQNGLLLFNQAQITANAFEGQGGNIQIDTGVLFQDPSSHITASSELGIDGTVEINEQFDVLDAQSGLFTLNNASNLPTLNIGCEDVELIRQSDLSGLNQHNERFSAKLTQSEPSSQPIVGNAIEQRNGTWIVVRYLTHEEVEALGCDLQSYHPSILVAQVENVPIIQESMTLKKIDFEGNTLFSDEELQQEVSHYLGKSYSPDELTIALQEIQTHLNNFYQKQQGYIFSGVYLEQGQESEQGTIIFQVIEKGSLSNIKVKGLKRIPESYLKNRINALVKPPLNVNRLIFALSTLQNDPRFEKITAELQEGRVLAITVVESPAFELGMEGNNYNSYLVGENQLQLSASSNNLLGLADSANFQWQHTEGSDQFYIDYAIPINGMGGEFTLSYQQGNTILLISPLDQFDIEQFSHQAGVRYTQPVVWTPNNQLSLYAGLDWRKNRSTLLGDPFSFTPEIQDATTQYTALYVGQSWLNRGNNQAFLINNEFRFGVDWFDATVLDTPSGIDGRFFLWRFQAQYINQLAEKWLFRAGFFGQLTPDALLFGERIQIGGIYSVPGFAYNQFSGDNGYYGTVAVEYTLFNRDDWGRLKVFPYFSSGFVDNNKFVSPYPDTIASVALGLHYERDWFYARFDYAQPLTANVRNQNILGQFGVKWTF